MNCISHEWNSWLMRYNTYRIDTVNIDICSNENTLILCLDIDGFYFVFKWLSVTCINRILYIILRHDHYNQDFFLIHFISVQDKRPLPSASHYLPLIKSSPYFQSAGTWLVSEILSACNITIKQILCNLPLMKVNLFSML